MTTIRKINARTYAVIHDYRERARFSAKKGETGEMMRAKAIDWSKRYLSPGNPALCEDTVLFCTEAQTVCHITNGGDNSEPANLGPNSLIRICDDSEREIVLTGEEFAMLCKQGSLLQIMPFKL